MGSGSIPVAIYAIVEPDAMEDDEVKISFRAPKILSDRLEATLKKCGIKKSDAMRHAMLLYLKEFEH